MRPMRLVYFAWVRERIGKAEEEVVPPPSVATIADLMRWLGGRGEVWGAESGNDRLVRIKR